MKFEPSTYEPRTYKQGGKEKDATGKQHVVMRTRCFYCDEALSEMHYECCGFSSCGWMSNGIKKHACK